MDAVAVGVVDALIEVVTSLWAVTRTVSEARRF